MSKLLIVLENRLLREALAQCLSRSGQFGAVASAGSAFEALLKDQELQPDVVLVGLNGDVGPAAVRTLRLVTPAAAVVVIGVSERMAEALDWADAGALAFVPESASLEDLTGTLELVLRGESSHLASYAASLAGRFRAGGRAPRRGAGDARLTSREREILLLIDRGCSNKDIARQLGIEVATVKNHVHNILEKLHAHRRSEAAAMAAGRSS